MYNAFKGKKSIRVADSNVQETEALLKAKTGKGNEELTLKESLLLMPGLSRKDVVTLILDILFAGIDTVREFCLTGHSIIIPLLRIRIL